MFHRNHNNPNFFILYNCSLYAHAFNYDSKVMSEAKIDLTMTPFIMNKEKQDFSPYGEYSKCRLDKGSRTHSYISIKANGVPGGFGPKNDDD